MKAEEEKKLAALVLALGVFVALLFPELTRVFAPFLLPSLFFVMVFSLLPFARHGGHDLIRLHPMVPVLVVWQQFVLPAGTLVAGYAFGLDKQWLYFILVTVTSGSLFASPTLVQLMGLDQKIAVQSVILSTIAAPFSIYLTFSVMEGNYVALNLGLFGFRLAVFLALPIAIFLFVRWRARRWTETGMARLESVGRWGSVLALVAFCFALEDQVNQVIKNHPDKLLGYFAVAIGVIVVVGVLTRIVMARYGVKAAVTATILTSFRNVGLTFGLVGSIAGPELAVYVGICQIPMFFSPLLFDIFFSKRTAAQQAREAELKANDPDADPDPNGGPQPARSFQYESGANGTVTAGGSVAAQASTLNGEGMATAYATNPNYVDGREFVTQGNAAVAVAMPEPESQADRDAPYKSMIDKLGALNTEARKDMARLASETSARHISKVNITAFIVFCILGVVGVWRANQHFAPMLFDQGLIREVAVTHTNNKNFGVFDLNINIRDLRNETIARMPVAPEAVVLGASHWQEARVTSVRGKNFYNSHVHRDYYEDMMAMTEMYVRHGKMPKEMIITIRDNLLTPVADRTDFLWLPGIKYYRAFAKRIGFKTHSHWETLPTQTWRELVSLPLLWTHGSRQLTAPVQPHATDKRFTETLDILLPGGSIVWSGEHKRMFTQERARAEALAFAKARRNDPPKIDPKGIKHMEALFDFLVSKGVAVTLAHPQFNPIYWDAVQGSPYMDGLKRVEDLTKHWAKKYGFEIIGGFAPSDVGCTADMYIDAEHGNSKCLGMLLQQYNVARLKFDIRGSFNGTGVAK